jgi:hypothetical protein
VKSEATTGRDIKRKTIKKWTKTKRTVALQTLLLRTLQHKRNRSGTKVLLLISLTLNLWQHE